MPVPPTKLKLAVAPTMRPIFESDAVSRKRDEVLGALKKWGVDFVSLEGVYKDGLLVRKSDLSKAVQHFRKAGADAVFFPHVNFGAEEAVGVVARELGLPVLLWGPRDGERDGSGLRERDTQCGLFATGKMLRRMRVPFTYLVNSWADEPAFERGVRDFLRAVAAARAFRGARVGQVSTRPDEFFSVIVNEGELLERWNVSVVPVSFSLVANRVTKKVAEKDKAALDEAASLKQRLVFEGLSDEDLLKVASLKVALREWAGEEGLSCIAFQCWPAIQEVLGLSACFVLGELSSIGLPAACETDIHGALSMLLLQSATLGSSPAFLADLTVRHPSNENAELIWHCGPFPVDFSSVERPKLTHHYLLTGASAGVGHFKVRDGDITFARFDGDGGEYGLFLGQARTCQGPEVRGTYAWVEVSDWPLWEEKVVTGPYIHHIAGAYGKVAPALYEACKYIGGVKADPAEPSAEELRAHWRGEDLVK